MLRIAIQAKGRLNEDTMQLLTDAGIDVAQSKRKLVARAKGFRLKCSTCATMTYHKLCTWV